MAADYDYNPPMVDEAAFPAMQEYIAGRDGDALVYSRRSRRRCDEHSRDIQSQHGFGVLTSVGSLSGSVAAGYQLNDLFRMEGELGFTGLGDYDSDPTCTTCPGTTSTGAATTVPCTEETDGNSHAWTFLVNGFFDFGTFARITPYVGAGAGIAYTDNGVYTETLCTDSASCNLQLRLHLYTDDREREFHFAYQLSAGASYDLNERLKLDLGYRLFAIPGAKQLVRDGDSVTFEDSTMQHQIRVGLRLGL